MLSSSSGQRLRRGGEGASSSPSSPLGNLSLHLRTIHLQILVVLLLLSLNPHHLLLADSSSSRLRGLFSFFSSSSSSGSWNPASWMADRQQSIYPKHVKDILFPGTHDSAAYTPLSRDPAPGELPKAIQDLVNFAHTLHLNDVGDFINKWSEAQDQNLYQQLRSGIRYLDIRAGWDAKTNQWRTFHANYGAPVRDLLQDVKRFLSEQRGEVVLVEVSHLNGGPSAENRIALAEMIVSTLGEFLAPRNGQGLEVLLSQTTIGDLVKQNHRAIISFEDDSLVPRASFPELWPASLFLHSYADSCDLKAMTDYNAKKSAEFKSFSAPQLFKISWTLTPDPKCIFANAINPFGRHSLMKLADSANGDPLNKFAAANPGALGNIVLLDHFQTSRIVEIAVAMSSS